MRFPFRVRLKDPRRSLSLVLVQTFVFFLLASRVPHFARVVSGVLERSFCLLFSDANECFRRISILGSFNNIKVARDAICQLILGSPPGKVYARLQSMASRINERF